MSRKNSRTAPTWQVPKPAESFIISRDAAAAWVYALMYEKHQEGSLLERLLQDSFLGLDLSETDNLVHRRAEFSDAQEALILEILSLPMGENYEILPYRQAVLKVLAIDFFSNVKCFRAIYAQDAIERVLRVLGEELRGSTKNAVQIISGQRTKLRKTMRAICMAATYCRSYRPNESIDRIFENLEDVLFQLVDEDIYRDCFPLDDMCESNAKLNARGRFALVLAMRMIYEIESKKSEIDEILQKASVKWRLSRISIIDLTLLRIATYEIVFEKIAPVRVLINEAVELAKVFGAEQSKNFVNGILQQVCTDNEIEIN